MKFSSIDTSAAWARGDRVYWGEDGAYAEDITCTVTVPLPVQGGEITVSGRLLAFRLKSQKAWRIEDFYLDGGLAVEGPEPETGRRWEALSELQGYRIPAGSALAAQLDKLA